MTKRVFGI